MNIGCGLYGLATDLEKDFWGTLKDLKNYGFTAIEPLIAFENDPALLPDSPVPSFLRTIIWDKERVLTLKPELKKLGLEISSMHANFLFGINPDNTDEAINQLLEIAKQTGINNFVTSLTFDTKEKCESAANLLNHANKILNPHGVILAYHNHEMEFSKIHLNDNQVTLMEYFFTLTDANVKLQLDTGWQMYGHDDVGSFMKKYANRIISVHLKDFIPNFDTIEKNDAFAPIGSGMLPTKEILTLLPQLQMFENGLMIDQDHAAKNANLLANLKVSMNFLKSLEY